MVRCAVFDIDDTLYLERDYVRSGFAAAGAWASLVLGVDGMGQRAWAEFESGRRGDIFDKAFAEQGLHAEPEVIQAMVRVYRSHRPQIKLEPDAAGCLNDLHGWVRLAAVTDGPAESQRAKATALGLDRLMSPIVFTADLGPGKGKPHPEAFRMVEDLWDVHGRECVYVADNPGKDFAGPTALGWITLRVIRPCGLHARTPSGADVECEVSELSRLPEILRALR